MPDTRIERIAEVLVNYSLDIQPGQKLLIRGGAAAEALIRESYRKAMHAGALVSLQVGLPGLSKIFFEEASDVQLEWVQPLYRMAAEEYDAYLAIQSEVNTREGSGFDNEKEARFGRAVEPVRETFFERAAAGNLKWCVTIFPDERLRTGCRDGPGRLRRLRFWRLSA